MKLSLTLAAITVGNAQDWDYYYEEAEATADVAVDYTDGVMEEWTEWEEYGEICYSNADCPDIMPMCGWVETGDEWSTDFCMPEEACD